MSLPIPPTAPHSEWRQRFLECNAQELTVALQDCLDYAERMDEVGQPMRAMCYKAVWPKLIQQRIDELSQGEAA